MPAGTSVGEIHIDLDADISKFKKGMSQAEKDSNSFTARAGKRLTEHFEKATAASLKFGAALAGVGAGLVAFGVKSVKAFTESDTAARKLEKLILNQEKGTLKQVESLKEQAKAIQKVGVVTDDAVVAAQAQLATFDFTSEAIEKVIPGFIDMAVAEKGVNIGMDDMKDLANGLGKAMQGNTELFTKQGFVISDAQKKILEHGNEMERVTTIAEILGGTYRGMNAAMRDTFEGQMIVAKNNMGDFEEAVGEFLKNALSPMLVKFNELTEAMGGPDAIFKKFKDSIVSLRPQLPIIIGAIGGGLVLAFRSLAAAIFSATVNLGPYILIGAALGQLYKHLNKETDRYTVQMKHLGQTVQVSGGQLDKATEVFKNLSGKTKVTMKDLIDLEKQGIPVINDLKEQLHLSGISFQEFVDIGGLAPSMLSDVFGGIRTANQELTPFQKLSREAGKAVEYLKDQLNILIEYLNKGIGWLQLWWADNGPRVVDILHDMRDAMIELVGQVQQWWGVHGPALIDMLAKVELEFRRVLVRMELWWRDHGPQVLAVMDRISAAALWLGSKLLDLAKWIWSVIEAAREWWEKHGPMVKVIMQEISDFITNIFLKPLQDLWKEWKDHINPEIKEFYEKHGPNLKQVLMGLAIVIGIIVIPPLLIMAASVLLVLGVIGLLAKAISTLIKIHVWWESLLRSVAGAIVNFITWSDKMRDKLWDLVTPSERVRDVLKSIQRVLLAISTGGFSEIMRFGASKAFEGMKSFAEGVVMKAEGGPVSSRMPYIVGEKGPELFIPNMSGKIIPTGKTKDIMNQPVSTSQNYSVVNNVSLNSDAAVEAFEQRMNRKAIAANFGLPIA